MKKDDLEEIKYCRFVVRLTVKGKAKLELSAKKERRSPATQGGLLIEEALEQEQT